MQSLSFKLIEFFGEGEGSREALVAFFGEGSQDDLFEFDSNFRAEFTKGGGLLFYVFEHHSWRSFGVKGEAAGEHLKKKYTEAIDIGAVIERLAQTMFWRHIGWSAEDDTWRSDNVIFRQRPFGDAEIYQFHYLGVVVHAMEDDIGGFEIPMDNASRVSDV